MESHRWLSPTLGSWTKPVNSPAAFVSTTEISVATKQDWLCLAPIVPCLQTHTDHVSIKCSALWHLGVICYVSMEKSFDVQPRQQLRYEGLESGEGNI